MIDVEEFNDYAGCVNELRYGHRYSTSKV